MLTGGDSGQADGQKRSYLMLLIWSLSIISLVIASLSGGSGYAAGADLDQLINELLENYGYPPLPANLITDLTGGFACLTFSLFNMAASQKFWSDLKELIEDHLQKYGCTRQNTFEITTFIFTAILGMVSAYTSASFTYEAIELKILAFGVAGTNLFGTGMANRKGLDGAKDWLVGLFKKGSQQTTGTKKCCNGKTIGKSFLFFFALISCTAGLFGLTVGAMLGAENEANQWVIGACGIPPLLVFSKGVFDRLCGWVYPLKGPEADELRDIVSSTKKEYSTLRKVGVPLLAGGPVSAIASSCLSAASAVVTQDLFEQHAPEYGTTKIILMIVVMILGFLGFMIAFEDQSSSMVHQGIDKCQNLIKRCRGKRTGEGAPLLANADGRVTELPQ